MIASVTFSARSIATIFAAFLANLNKRESLSVQNFTKNSKMLSTASGGYQNRKDKKKSPSIPFEAE